MPSLGKYVTPPGEKVSILAFTSDLKTLQILDGYKKEGSLAINGIEQKGFVLDGAEAMIYKNAKGKPIGMIYPVIYELASGVKFLGMGKPKKYPDEPTSVDRLIKRLSPEITVPIAKSPINFKVEPTTIEMKVDPRLIGKALDNGLMKNVLSLKSEFWQLVLCLLFGLLVGAVAF